MKGATQWRFAMLATVPFIMVLGNSMLIPGLPVMQEKMHLTKTQVGLLITIFSIPAGLTIPLAGMLSDRIGRKKVMVPALIVYGLGGLIAGVAAWLLQERAYTWVMAGRLIQGIGAGGTYQLAMALTGDIFKTAERTKALGLLEAANGLGKVVSPVAGAAALALAWFSPFFIYGLLALPVAAGVWWIVKEPRLERAKGGVKQYFGSVVEVFRQKGATLGAAFVAGATVLFVLFGALSYYSDVLEDRMGLGGIRKGFVLAGPVLASAVTSYITGTVLQKYLARWGKAAVVTGLGLVAAGLLATAWLRGAVWLFVAMTVIGLGNGLVLPALNTIVTGAAGPERRGAVTAVYGTVRFFGVALGPPTFTLLDKLGFGPWVTGTAVAVAAVAGLAMWGLRPPRQQGAAGGAGAAGSGQRAEGREGHEQQGQKQRPAVAYRQKPK